MAVMFKRKSNVIGTNISNTFATDIVYFQRSAALWCKDSKMIHINLLQILQKIRKPHISFTDKDNPTHQSDVWNVFQGTHTLSTVEY